MATTDDAARWMLAELEAHGELSQVVAAAAIRARFGADFVHQGRVRKAVLRAFHALAPGRIVWAPSTLGWRWRNRFDPPA